MEFKHNLKLLISREEIAKKVAEYGAIYNEKYKGKTLSLVTILNGSVFFFADFARMLEMPIKMDTITASSYSGTKSNRELVFHKKITKPIIENQHVLIIEDIIDSGLTLEKVYEYILSLKPKSLEILTLASKKSNHKNFKYKYTSLFEVPDIYVLGYGFEIDDLYRQLPEIYTLEEE
ncbi:phosphoribosyltransferase [Mesoplasma tabanidae]|uniref:Hypoxanthine-guanine phosphoribosyltransferase n=1 Tax=Mesoplasma tabanidae TaxID=219745 RepID=A0A2K8P436_9MOLU|nr:phosphoribosyltransferase family protein [Mesoplasma tabanidae]ATZ21238.1 hypoxanthine-guanine phosphoribosyltransferase [Mesoplasma tabanidae]